MSKKMNAGEAAALMLKVKADLEPAWSNIPVLEAVYRDITARLTDLHNKRDIVKSSKAVQQ